jgi:2-hydroxychromene-2-carboxylate isomerase
MSYEFWFDYHSPWSYLAATKIEEIATRHNIAIQWRPLHLANLIDAIDGRRPLEESPAFVRWYQQDLQDWAGLYGLSIRYHPDFPLRPARALRATLFAVTQEKEKTLALAVFHAYWTESRDISDLNVLGDLGAKCGLERDAVIAAATASEWKNLLDENTKEAIEGGIFGVPTINAGGRLFFGNDRLEFFERYLDKLF